MHIPLAMMGEKKKEVWRPAACSLLSALLGRWRHFHIEVIPGNSRTVTAVLIMVRSELRVTLILLPPPPPVYHHCKPRVQAAHTDYV